MPEPEITSGKVLDVKNDERHMEMMQKVAEAIDTDSYIILFKPKNAKCQRPTCEEDHLGCLFSKVKSEDFMRAINVLAKIGSIKIDEEGGIPSPFTNQQSES